MTSGNRVLAKYCIALRLLSHDRKILNRHLRVKRSVVAPAGRTVGTADDDMGVVQPPAHHPEAAAPEAIGDGADFVLGGSPDVLRERCLLSTRNDNQQSTCPIGRSEREDVVRCTSADPRQHRVDGSRSRGD
jgi:hypothetical protein